MKYWMKFILYTTVGLFIVQSHSGPWNTRIYWFFHPVLTFLCSLCLQQQKHLLQQPQPLLLFLIKQIDTHDRWDISERCGLSASVGLKAFNNQCTSQLLHTAVIETFLFIALTFYDWLMNILHIMQSNPLNHF